MLKNYLKIAFRNINRRKVSTTITATGLILGIAAFIFILEYVSFEFNTNKFHSEGDNIYRVLSENKFGEFSAHLPPVTAPAISENVGSVVAATRFAEGICGGVLKVSAADNSDQNTFREENCIFTDEHFFELFSFEFISGNADLSTPKTAVITSTLAQKYFNTIDVIGKEFTLFNQFGETDFLITGVLESISPQSDLNFGVALSFNTLSNPANRNGSDWADPMGWDNGFSQNFLLLGQGTNPDAVNAEIQELKYQRNPNDESVIHLQKLSDLHLAPSLSYVLPTSGSLSQVLLILCVGIMIMIIGWANYINLSTAQGIERSKQVGIQQTSGATKIQLMGQFLMETFIFTIISSGCAFALVELLQPYFNQLVDKPLSLELLNVRQIWVFGGLFFLMGTLAAGGYVAFVLTSMKPNEILKGVKGAAGKGLTLRRILVVFQFSISIVLIVVTFVFSSQLKFMQTRDLGMKLDNRLVIRGPSINENNQNQSTDAFKDKLASFPFVEKFTGSNSVPGKGNNFYASGITGENPSPDDAKKSFGMLIIDESYFNTYDIELAAGRNFSQTAISAGWSSDELIINEKAVQQLGYTSSLDALEKPILWGTNTYKIAGVIKDYNHASLQELIDPMIFIPSNSNVYFTVKLQTENLDEAISVLGSAFEEYYPGNPYEYFFIADEYDAQYSAEQRFGNLFRIAALMAVFIACLGLFGLAAYTATARTKEIGVRKVLGAGIIDITFLLTKDFIKLVGIGFLIAAPISWFVMKEWLTNFAYAVELTPWIFLFAGFISLLIAILTVSGRAIQAATLNPVDSLRRE